MRGKISIEYIAIVAFILFATVPVLYYATQKSNEDIRLSEADTATESMRSLVNKVYSLGKGTRDFTTVNFPSGIQDILVGGPTGQANPNEFIMKLGIFGSTNDIVKTTIAPSICLKLDNAQQPIQLPKGKGTYRIFAEYVDRTTPNICKIELSCGTDSCT